MKENNKIRVLHILTRLIAAGADENTLFTIQGVDPNRFESTLLVGRDSEIIEEMRNQGVNIIIEPYLRRDIHLLSDIIALININRIIRRSNFNIVHTHTAKAGFIGRLAAKIAGVPIIIHTLHGLSFHDFMPRWQKRLFILLERFVGQFTNLFISVGENIKAKSIAEKIGSEEKYITIYSGMDLSKFSSVDIIPSKKRAELGLDAHAPVIGTVARLEPRKGPQYFVEVVRLVREEIPNINAVIVGKGSYETALRKKSDEYGLNNNLFLTGFRKDIEEVMAVFDIVCLTSLWEGIPRVLIQGALLGKPLIAFDIDGNSEVVKDGKNGFLIPPISVELFANRVIELLKDKELRKKFSENSKTVIDKRWDKRFMVKEIEKQYLILYDKTKKK